MDLELRVSRAESRLGEEPLGAPEPTAGRRLVAQRGGLLDDEPESYLRRPSHIARAPQLDVGLLPPRDRGIDLAREPEGLPEPVESLRARFLLQRGLVELSRLGELPLFERRPSGLKRRGGRPLRHGPNPATASPARTQSLCNP
jgi:hypothetical protein